jgi:hypothetical protein
MERTNGQVPEFRAEAQMMLIVDADSYAEIGALMDEVHHALHAAIKRSKLRARFDFTGFNTRPCKRAQMARLSEVEMDMPALSPTVADF